MQTKQLSFSLSLLLTLCLFHDTQAQQAGQIESMKLLTADTGWAATHNKLFWTTDGGTSWKDITPKLNHKHQMVSSVFFLDMSTGWALLSCSDDRDIASDNSCFALASTVDAGESWSVTQEKIAHPFPREQLEDGYGFSGRSWLDFVDSQHGWEIVDIATNSTNPSAGEMLRTVDGGKTWTPTKDAPTSDHFIFVTPTNGWIAGGKDHEIFVTHDAGDSWQKVSLPKPPNVGPDTGIDSSLPVFENERRGILPIRYAVGPLLGPDLSTIVLFITDDGGKSWRLDRTLSRVPNVYCSDVVGSTLIAIHSQLGKKSAEAQNGPPKLELSLYGLGQGQDVSSNSAEVFSNGAPVQLSFVSRDRGWVNLLDGLFATHDGGRTWFKVTPRGAQPSKSQAMQVPTEAMSTQIELGAGEGAPAMRPASGSNVSAHLGFDAYNVPTLSQMMAWWSSSPYYDIAIYLQGSKNGHKDPILGSANGPAWVSTVEGQGWGLIPAWVGLRSPCACYKTNTSTGKCTQAYPSVFSSNPGQDGNNEAIAAISAAVALGVTTPIIYKDIENYYGPTLCTPTQQAAAGAAVQAFVSGWDSQLHTNGYLAGVYGNPKPAQSDFSQAATIPDDVWITKTPLVGKPPSVTIWSLAPLTDGPWPNGQRIHQFLINQANVTFGNVALEVDDDIDNATIANANSGAKNYSSYSFSSLDYPGASETEAYGINDVSGGAFINGPGQVGQIVGGYIDSTGYWHGFLLNGLTSWSPISGPSGAISSWATGINNLGQIVGVWVDASDCFHGYLLKPGQTAVSIDNPNAVCPSGTSLTGINDAGQISGFYVGGVNPSFQSFLYYGATPTFYLIPLPGNCCYNFTGVGINGDAAMAGSYGAQNGYNGFVDSPVPPTWTGPYSSFFDAAGLETVGAGINNNGDVAGYYEVSYLDDFAFLFTNGVQRVSFQYPTNYDTYGFGVNDFGQMAGYYRDSTPKEHVFVRCLSRSS